MSWRWSVLAVVLVGALAVRADRSLDGPSVPPERADALRALHRRLFTDTPRPIGSAEAAAARARIVEALAERGCPVSEQVAWTCVPGRCARVTNLWCRLGPSGGSAVVGLAHTDSVAAGPGAGDDGAGVVAWVEAVGVLAREDLRRPFVLLLTDGEEEGLMGVRAALDAPPFPDPIGTVVNLEARGTGGASLMFQTVGAELAWGRVLAGLRPNGSTTYTAIYDQLPNDTDLTVVGEHGLQGVNHAFLANLAHYHTPLDDLHHLDVRSMAHHADAALAHVRTLQRPPAGEQVFTDVLGWFVLRWPAGLTLPLAVGALLGWLGWLAADVRSGRTTGRALALAVVAVPAAAAAGVLLAELAGAAVPDPAWWGNPEPIRVAAWAATIGALLPLGAVGDPYARWHAVLGPAALGALALALVEPRFTVLALPAALLAVGARALGEPGLLGLAVGLAASWLAYAIGLEEALSLEHAAVLALPLALALLGTAPALPARWAPGSAAMLVVAVAAVAAGIAGPSFTPDRPQHVTLVLTQARDGTTHLEALAHPGEPPPDLAEGVVLKPLGLPPPVVQRQGDDRLLLKPARGGRTLRALTDRPLDLGDGVVAEPRRGGITLAGVPSEGVLVRGSVERLVEETDGLPPELTPWSELRGDAVPVHDGDRTVVHGR